MGNCCGTNTSTGRPDRKDNPSPNDFSNGVLAPIRAPPAKNLEIEARDVPAFP